MARLARITIFQQGNYVQYHWFPSFEIHNVGLGSPGSTLLTESGTYSLNAWVFFQISEYEADVVPLQRKPRRVSWNFKIKFKFKLPVLPLHYKRDMQPVNMIQNIIKTYWRRIMGQIYENYKTQLYWRNVPLFPWHTYAQINARLAH